jgi:hypothetical protein
LNRLGCSDGDEHPIFLVILAYKHVIHSVSGNTDRSFQSLALGEGWVVKNDAGELVLQEFGNIEMPNHLRIVG